MRRRLAATTPECHVTRDTTARGRAPPDRRRLRAMVAALIVGPICVAIALRATRIAFGVLGFLSRPTRRRVARLAARF
jgi:hypothetical protein